MLASTESLLAEMNRLHAYVSDMLERGKVSGDDRLLLLAVKEGRGDAETLFKIGSLSDLQRQINELAARQERGSE